METLHKKTKSRISVRDAVRICVLSSGGHARDLANSGSPDSDTPLSVLRSSVSIFKSQLVVDSPLFNLYSNATPPEIGIPRIIILASLQQFDSNCLYGMGNRNGIAILVGIVNILLWKIARKIISQTARRAGPWTISVAHLHSRCPGPLLLRLSLQHFLTVERDIATCRYLFCVFPTWKC